MKILILVLASLAASFSVYSAEGNRSERRGMNPEVMANHMFDMFDADKNNGLGKEEMELAINSMFDERIERQTKARTKRAEAKGEVIEGGMVFMHPIASDVVLAIFESHDRDGNGAMNFDELKESISTIRKYNLNGMGRKMNRSKS